MPAKTVVIIPHFNNINGLLKSIMSVRESIEVDLLVIDDGSIIKPRLNSLVNHFKNTGKINILFNDINLGITKSLNLGLKYVHDSNKYDYIARLDCGDLFYPDKLKLQLKFLQNNQNIYLVGTWVKYINLEKKYLFNYCPPVDDVEIKKQLHSGNQFNHSSIMFRTKCIDLVGFYLEKYIHAEDYAYFFAIAKRLQVANINKILVESEINPDGISLQNRKQQLRSVMYIIWDNFDYSFRAFRGGGLLFYLSFYSLQINSLAKNQSFTL